MNIKEKISKIIAFIENEIHLKFKVQSEYTVTFFINDFENTIHFDPSYIKGIDVKTIEKPLKDTIKLFSSTENTIISFNKHGVHYNKK